MLKVQIEKSPTADTRYCDWGTVSKEQLLKSSEMHIDDVRSVLHLVMRELVGRGALHDIDKIDDIDGFHADFKTGFKQKEWFNRHKELNRHHLQDADGIPEDVNLIDVVEMVADICCAAAARNNGKFRPPEISDDLLRRAFDNMITWVQDRIEIVEDANAVS